MSDFFIARQPIFDQSLKLFAYELLFRSADTGAAPQDLDDDLATAQVLNISEEVGLPELVGERPAFINLPRRFLSEPELLPFAPDNVVLEVLEHVEIDDAVIEGMKVLGERGYTLALDDFVYDARFDAALKHVSIVKLEIPEIAPENWGAEISRLKDLGVKVLAEKVETNEEFETLKSLGCDYFQGYFFAKPKVVTGKRLAANKLAVMQLMSQINNPETEIEDLSELVSRDVAISVRAMNYANSPAAGLSRQIDSIREAVIYIGRETIRRWVTLLIMARLDDKPGELITMTLIRGRFLELMAEEANQEGTDSFFTVGLFSVLDALMDAPLEEVLQTLSLTEDLMEALCQHQGVRGECLQLAKALEQGELSGFEPFQIPAPRVAELHQAATQWADETLSGMANA
ncbi:EAL and HDOD domain-containing protein [Congregibacter litoralis]|uniref:Diguanylate phosphodiesterase n=1 Tax=Congregibacter litoralis KT71 TaxID=314285 RepID=A4AD21_9GAMM|nr:EAL domain-containing protein [Congregibacter litoralis]EAQ96074.1 diguanylate phosphodiesterase [Congregibacter litoralis KT71]